MKKIISSIISISLILISAPVFAMSGAGTESNPYLVSTPQDVCNIHNDLDGYYKLTTDIDMSGIEFEPIGNESEGAFTGTIDGNGHTISNLDLNLPGNKYVGLVGYLEGTVKNITIKNAHIVGYRYMGSIAGYSKSSYIINCVNYSKIEENSVNNMDGYAGGISGFSYKSSMINCVNFGEILGYHAGGITTANYNEIRECINFGKIYGRNSSSGICVINRGLISECINYGDIGIDQYYSGQYYSGGISVDNLNNIENCINVGTVIAVDRAGGIATYNDDSGVIKNCFNSGWINKNSGPHYINDGMVGGIVGIQRGQIISNCMNYGLVTGNVPYRDYLGGIVGYWNVGSNNYCNNCVNYGAPKQKSFATSEGNNYSLANISIEEKSINLDYYECKQQTNFNLDFNNSWFIDPNTNSGFPQLHNLPRHISLNACVEILEKGDSDTLQAYIDGVSESVTWSSQDEEIADITQNGKVTAKSIGSCMITATNSEGLKANCLIYVYARADSISLNKSETTIAVGSWEKLTYTENPDTANETVVWSSDNENIATVSQDGTVIAKKKGIANITATTTNSEVSASCRVTVIGTPITSVSLSSTSTTMNVGENKTLTTTVSPTEYAGTITWSSTNNEVATVDNGIITAKAPGTAVISVESDTNKTANCTVTVKAPVTEMSFDKTELTLEKGYTQKLNLNIVPLNTTDTISWSTSSSDYVSVSSDGTITANRAGTATITATSTSGKKAYCVVNVTEPTTSVSSVTLSKTELTMTQADKTQLTAEVLPSNATNKELVWTSSDEAVATVSNTGVVTATGVGTAIIKATANNGMYHECAVKVISASGPSVVLSNAKTSPNGTAQVKASIVKNPGISGYKFTVEYDDTILTPVSVEADPGFGGTLTTNLDDEDRTELNILWYSDSDVDMNGDLFTITFEVNNDAGYGDSSAISLNYGAKDICNVNGDSLALYIQDSTVNIAEPLLGDIYEDDEVTVFDLTLLARYITGLETFTARQSEAGDVNDDNAVDIKDVVTLAQYLVGWSGIKLAAEGETPEGSTRLTVGTASVNEAMEAEIPVYIENNSGISGFRYVIDHSDDIEILSITPAMEAIKDSFQTNLGQQGDNDLIVSWYDTDNMTENGELFIIRARLTNPDADISSISIVPADNNMCDENKINVIAEYEDGYVLSDSCVKANESISDTSYSCELYFDNTFEEQTASAILAFYDEQGKLVQLKNKEITVKQGKADLSFDIENKPYSTYKLMLWEGMDSMRPLVDVR